ncbi:MAG TPA: M14 family zinc carboxypeptidase, partial [Candidatus Edwardsbacteria bacterium]|nr:M14 family zinc carboxypeptidase [Candidatus Edwardsbacteria bacterium]
MKKIILFAFLSLVLVSVAGAAVSDLMPANVQLKTHDDAYWLTSNGINIEELRGNVAEVRLTKDQLGMLTAAGYAVTPRAEARITDAQLTGYHNYTQLTSFLDSIHALYPSITKKVSVGTTVQGRNLWAFLVTSYPDSQMNKPEIRLAANIHGDEVVGKELLLAMIDSLTKSYGSNATITNYVNTREIWFMPSANPDGLTLSQRYNANGEDLNRDYPVPDGGSNGGSVSGTETETQEMMSYWGAKHVVLSMMLHGGSVVANYPWDYTATVCPDDSLARAVALGYSRLNSPMWNSSEFTNGITEGGSWYIVRGSLQDWSYNTGGGLEITVECSADKWPAASTLPGYWNDNKNSLLYFIRKCGEGIGGVVTDSASGLPLNGVTVTVAGTGKAITTDVPGDYHRMLTSGTYSLSFAKSGYTTKTVSSVRVNYDSLTTLNVALKSTSSTTPTLAVSMTSWAPAAAGATSSAVSVTNSGSSSVIAYTVSSDQTWLTVSSASGSTPGSFTMTAAANTGSARTATVTVTATTSGVSGSPKTIAVSQAAATTTPALAVSTTSWSPAAAGATSSAVSVTNSGSTSAIAYTVSSNQTWLTVSSASGSTPGSFTMTAAANTGAARTATVTVTATTSGVANSPQTIAVSQAAGTSQVTIFSDDMTNFPTGWTLSPAAGWTKSSTRANSASSSARCDDVSPYANSQTNTMARAVSLTGYSGATLTF